MYHSFISNDIFDNGKRNEDMNTSEYWNLSSLNYRKNTLFGSRKALCQVLAHVVLHVILLPWQTCCLQDGNYVFQHRQGSIFMMVAFI